MELFYNDTQSFLKPLAIGLAPAGTQSRDWLVLAPFDQLRESKR